MHPMKAMLVDSIDVISFPLPFNVKDSSLEDKAISQHPILLTHVPISPLPFSLPGAHALSVKMRELLAQTLKWYERLHLQLDQKSATRAQLEVIIATQHVGQRNALRRLTYLLHVPHTIAPLCTRAYRTMC